MKRVPRSALPPAPTRLSGDPAPSELATIRDELCKVLNGALVSHLGKGAGVDAEHTLSLWRAHGPKLGENLLQCGWNPTQAQAVACDNDRLADMLSYVVALQRPTSCIKEALWGSVAIQHFERSSDPSRRQIALM